MKSFKMKALSLAVLGLAGLGFGASAFAACPTDPAQPAGPWSSKVTSTGTLAITEGGGAVGTNCWLGSAMSAGAGSLSLAVVRDDTPTNEARYRAQFYLDADLVTSFTGLQSIQVFQAQSAANGPSASRLMLRAVILPSGTAPSGKAVRFFLSTNTPTSYRTAGAPIDLATGFNRIQFDLVTAAAGSIKIWINNPTEASPTQTVSGDNAGWVGVDRAILGLAAPSPEYASSQAGKVVKFDEFDSRRSTFIN